MNQATIEDEKSRLRAKALVQRSILDASDRADAALAAAAHFFADVDLTETRSIAAYWPIRDEIDSKPILIKLMDLGFDVSLPVVVGEEVPLVFRKWIDGEALYPAGFGTLAPSELAPTAEPELLIIPLLGFDRLGTRLGYGRGYYDRTIAALPRKPLLVGYAFQAQELPEIPREAHDVPLDWLVTETGARKFAN